MTDSEQMRDESKALAVEIVRLFHGRKHQVCMTALVLAFGASIETLKMDTDSALNLFADQVRKTVKALGEVRVEKGTVQ